MHIRAIDHLMEHVLGDEITDVETAARIIRPSQWTCLIGFKIETNFSADNNSRGRRQLAWKSWLLIRAVCDVIGVGA
jgi:hypothetical protein